MQLYAASPIGFLPGGGYVVGESLVLLGSANRDRALADKLKAVLMELRDEVGAAVYFSRYDDGEEFLHVLAGTEPEVQEFTMRSP